MFKKAIKVGLLLVIVFALVVQFRPDHFSVSRSRTISAPPATVFAIVNDFHQWDAWSPWSKLDPDMKKSIEGPPAGVGASYTWDGNSQVGKGRSTIVESQPNERIRLRLDFIRPFEGTSDVEFTFRPEGSGTLMTWKMSGKNNFIGKAIGLFIDCDKMAGDQFEQGLSNLDALVQSQASAGA